ncbi:MAG: hypothetical protein R2795_05275 [Saprospiraceae bacterium]
MRISWFSLDGQGHTASAQTPLFALRFRALADINDWSEVLRIDEGSMLPEAYNGSEESLEPVIDFNNSVTDVEDPLVNAPLYYIKTCRNPMQDATRILLSARCSPNPPHDTGCLWQNSLGTAALHACRPQ